MGKFSQGFPGLELGVVGFELAVFGMRQETPQVRPETQDPDTVRLSGVQVEVLGGGQEGGLSAAPGRA